MTLVALCARLVLAAVFAVAGVAKLCDVGGTRKAVVDFGAPKRLAGPLSIVVPLVELAAAALLVFGPTAVVGAVTAILLIALFSGAVAYALVKGRTPSCHCFGQLHSAPASRRALVRNAGLAALGVLALAGSLVDRPLSAVAWTGRIDLLVLLATALSLGLAAVLVLGTTAFVVLMRSYGRVLARLDRVESALAEAGIAVDEPGTRVGLEPGAEAPWFLAHGTDGQGISRDDLLAPGLPVLLLFTSPQCGSCGELLPAAARWQRDHADWLTVAFASSGSVESVAAEVAELDLELVMLDERAEIAESFGAEGTPAGVLIGTDGTVASWLALGRDAIEELVAQAVAQTSDGYELPVGAPAPALALPTLDGDDLSLDSLRGRETLLLFWNPGCGFCREMHGELLAWEATTNGHGPRLVVVSSGDEGSTRADGFRSTVLLDAEYAAGTAFGAGGTPMAVLLDAEGRVSSPLVAGAEAALELARGPVAPLAVA
jgi:thiol-disulfide isomerase/thioredoxin